MIFDIKRFAVHDGPGIRTTVFLKGCPLSCLWCHNPEGKKREPEFMWSEERCIACKTCQKVCPQGSLTFSEGLKIDKTCTLCRMCVDACPSQALQLSGRTMTVAQVLEEVEKDRIFYDESQGGVTFSGGEPLMQPGFLYSLLKACKRQGIHTTVDTCGYASTDILLRMTRYTDLFLYDVKVIDDTTHIKMTGVSNSLILENLRRLSYMKKPAIIRFPFVPGVNDTEEDITDLGRFVSSLECAEEVDILPYHKGGIAKVKKLGKDTAEYEPPSDKTLERARRILEDFRLKVKIGG